MLLTSGLNFGFRRSIPHMLGIGLGFSLMVLIVGVGLGEIFERYPIIHVILRYVSVTYLLYLAWKIMHSDAVSQSENTSKPISFLQAAAFQWVNPKAWMMATIAISTYASKQHFLGSVILLSILFIFFVIPSGCIWITFGNWFRRYLNQPFHLRVFNITMALLLVLSLYPFILEMIYATPNTIHS